MKKIVLFILLFLSIHTFSQVVCNFNIPDTSSCSSAPFTLRIPIGYTYAVWDDGDTTAFNTYTSSGIHWAKVTIIDTTTTNLVVNGDFEAGRTGFSSGYIVGLPGSSTWGLLGNPGTYEVLASPRDGHVNFFTCTDVTTAPGTLMLVANGASAATDVWCQTVAVTPNTNYIFSAWAANVLNDPNVAQLQFKINGSVIGAPFSTSAIGCNWRKFFAIWNSGTSTSANICIRNLNTTGGGNDFAIDEIRFSNICIFSDTFNYTVNAPTNGSIFDTTCSNYPYSFNGLNITTSGIYRDTLVNMNGCDSFLTLNLTVLPFSSFTINQSICSNSSYLFNGEILNTSGTYLDTLINYYGCDSFITLNLLINNTSTSSFMQTICSNQYYLYNGVNLNTAGIYLDTFSNYLGCDSVVTLNLNINTTTTGTINQTICSNQFYLFNGVNLNSAGTYIDTFINYLGCDSVVTLNLLVNRTSNSRKDTIICFGDIYFFNGVNLNTSGSYLDTIANLAGCDSIIQLNLIVIPYLTTTINKNICSNNSYFFNGIFLNTSGIYNDTLLNINGCDSFIILNLTVNLISNSTLSDTLCEGALYTFNNIQLTTSGTYNDTITNFLGCDSFITLQLIVNPNPIVFINGGNDTIIVEGQSVILTAYGAVNYLWNNGNTSNFQTVTPLSTTAYTVVGNDSNRCTASDTILVIVSEQLDSSKIAIPNAFSPNGDGINDLFRLLNTYNFKMLNMTIFNRWGEVVFLTDDTNIGWDGQFNNREQPIGTYVYTITGKSLTSQKTKTYTGIVTLIR